MNTTEEPKALAEALCKEFADATPEALLAYLFERFGQRIALASSLGPEDQVLTDMIVGVAPKARIFTIDTGRLFPETYHLIDRTNDRYGIRLEVYFPDHTAVEQYVATNGINAFYQSVEKRKACCHARKIEPLLRALSTLDVWVCGLRRSQSVTRTGVQLVEWDETNRLIKVNPLVDWSEEQMWQYVKEHQVPVNTLHRKNFPSIGCQPCTRAVEPGEDVRSGRWWWENPECKECGLHRR
jgi:phosphoadenosine phosphosulfate reductase